jgi:four helix bundle protein
VLGHEIATRLPRGTRSIADQFERAASSILLNTAEGAGRRAGKEKAHFFDMARGSATECAAILDVLEIRRLAKAGLLEEARCLLHQVVRLLAGLSRSALARSEPRR